MGGGENLDEEFRSYLTDNGIFLQLTAPGTLQQNGVAERRNRTMLDMMRSMLSNASLSKSFWGVCTTNFYLFDKQNFI